MTLSWWGWWVTGLAGVAVLIALRWALADFLLDRFGSPGTDRAASEHTSAEADVSRPRRVDDLHRAGLEKARLGTKRPEAGSW